MWGGGARFNTLRGRHSAGRGFAIDDARAVSGAGMRGRIACTTIPRTIPLRRINLICAAAPTSAYWSIRAPSDQQPTDSLLSLATAVMLINRSGPMQVWDRRASTGQPAR